MDKHPEMKKTQALILMIFYNAYKGRANADWNTLALSKCKETCPNSIRQKDRVLLLLFGYVFIPSSYGEYNMIRIYV
jgi:hypothetical protein